MKIRPQSKIKIISSAATLDFGSPLSPSMSINTLLQSLEPPIGGLSASLDNNSAHLTHLLKTQRWFTKFKSFRKLTFPTLFCWRQLVAGAGLLWEKITAGWLVTGAGLVWEKNTVGWLKKQAVESSTSSNTSTTISTTIPPQIIFWS